jgi:hypothetical protein
MSVKSAIRRKIKEIKAITGIKHVPACKLAKKWIKHGITYSDIDIFENLELGSLKPTGDWESYVPAIMITGPKGSMVASEGFYDR